MSNSKAPAFLFSDFMPSGACGYHENPMANVSLSSAKSAKNDEFYTQYHDIEVEMNAYLEYNPDVFRGKTILLPCDDPESSNFTRYFAAKFDTLGLKKLISTSYAPESKKMVLGGLFSEFERQSPQFNADKSKTHGKIFILDSDRTGDGRINIDDLHWDYLKGDGDFRSEEVTALRDEADIIITNPPFSLFRDFLSWIIAGEKKFALISNMNAITYKEVFPLIMQNKVWIGATGFMSDMVFEVPEGYKVKEADRQKAKRLGYDGNYTRLGNSCWLTSIDHGRRHEPLALMTMADNLRFSRHKELRGKKAYDSYDNYDAIEVPFTDAIPSDYDGVMGVPISFLGKYCPEQFEIVAFRKGEDGKDLVYSYTADSQGNTPPRKLSESSLTSEYSFAELRHPAANGERAYVRGERKYARLLIKHLRAGHDDKAEGKINGRITYARINIRKRKP